MKPRLNIDKEAIEAQMAISKILRGFSIHPIVSPRRNELHLSFGGNRDDARSIGTTFAASVEDLLLKENEGKSLHQILTERFMSAFERARAHNQIAPSKYEPSSKKKFGKRGRTAIVQAASA